MEGGLEEREPKPTFDAYLVLVEEVIKVGVSRVLSSEDCHWLPQTEAVRQRVARTPDAPAEITSVDLILAARRLIVDAAREATDPPEVALALIGAATGTKGKPKGQRYTAAARAAGYTSESSGRYFGAVLAPRIAVDIAEELYALVTVETATEA